MHPRWQGSKVLPWTRNFGFSSTWPSYEVWVLGLEEPSTPGFRSRLRVDTLYQGSTSRNSTNLYNPNKTRSDLANAATTLYRFLASISPSPTPSFLQIFITSSPSDSSSALVAISGFYMFLPRQRTALSPIFLSVLALSTPISAPPCLGASCYIKSIIP